MTETSSDTLARPSGEATERGLLAGFDAIANLAVKDLNSARQFYKDTLGFEPVQTEGDEAIVFRSGRTVFFVYRSDFAGTNQATALTWPVGNKLEEVVSALSGKGIAFERYDMPGMRRDGDIHVAGDMKIAWFKDPDGNILNVVNDDSLVG